MNKIRGNRVKAQFKWTPEHEEELEEILITFSFDFKSATRAFCKYVNKNDPDNFFEMDVKTIQLRWTDIEIRKYRLSGQSDNFLGGRVNLDDDLPALEESKELSKDFKDS
jgi:hypothetical protein